MCSIVQFKNIKKMHFVEHLNCLRSESFEHHVVADNRSDHLENKLECHDINSSKDQSA